MSISNDLPWVEKYRPKNVNDVVCQEEVISVLQSMLQKSADLPNLLFYGPPGTGKTSTILAACHQLFGGLEGDLIHLHRDRVLELNASDERGINVVRNKIKQFAQLAASGHRDASGRKIPAFKIVILDEADSMTTPAQAALRRLMEKETKTTRFCLICNYISRIIEPITSRCAKFRFKALPHDIMADRLKYICDQESVPYNTEVIDALVNISDGDMRKSVTFLQTAAKISGKDKITNELILEIAGIIPDNIIPQFLTTCQSCSFDDITSFIKNVLLEGYSAEQFLLQLHEVIVPSIELTDSSKAAICTQIAEIDKCLLDGADEELQLLNLGAKITTVLRSTA